MAFVFGPLLYAAAVYGVRRRETLPPLPSPPPHRELAAPVVNLLFGRGEVTPKAIETTSLQLVAAGRLRLERKADGTPTVRLTPAAEDNRHLRPFEQLLLERIRRRCRDNVDRVPIEALGPGDGDAYWIWWRGFQQSVQDEAMALGTTDMQKEWKALPAEDRKMMTAMMKETSSTEADFSAAIKAHGVLAVDGDNATLTVTDQKSNKGTDEIDIFVENLRRYFGGQPLINVIDKR